MASILLCIPVVFASPALTFLPFLLHSFKTWKQTNLKDRATAAAAVTTKRKQMNKTNKKSQRSTKGKRFSNF
jgi:hypothetical protein